MHKIILSALFALERERETDFDGFGVVHLATLQVVVIGSLRRDA
jgi:hypothetical protein